MSMQTLTWDVDAYSLALATQARQKLVIIQILVNPHLFIHFFVF